jgi:hypothetical protein
MNRISRFEFMMLIEFPEQTAVIAKDQPEYHPLPAHRFADDPQGRIACCWKLTWRERLTVLIGGVLWHQVLTFNQPLQPQLLSTTKPEMTKP